MAVPFERRVVEWHLDTGGLVGQERYKHPQASVDHLGGISAIELVVVGVELVRIDVSRLGALHLPAVQAVDVPGRPWPPSRAAGVHRQRRRSHLTNGTAGRTVEVRDRTRSRMVRLVTEPLSREIYNPVQRDRVVFIKTSSETGGELTLVELQVSPGGGNPLHFHTSFTERFMVDEGELGAQIGKRRLLLHVGESELVPVRTPHRWFNSSTTSSVRVRVELRPGRPGFEDSLRIGYGLARDGLVNSAGVPRNLLHVAVLAELSDTRIVGPMRPFNTVRHLASVARRRGVEADLKRRYCT